MIFLLIKPVTKVNRPENAFYTFLAVKMLLEVFISGHISIFNRVTVRKGNALQESKFEMILVPTSTNESSELLIIDQSEGWKSI